MTIGIIALCVLVLVLILYRLLEHRVSVLLRRSRYNDDRISSLEVKDYGQDNRMDGHDKTLDVHDDRFRRLHNEVKELGRDVGWDDDMRRTDIHKIDTPPDDT